MLRYALFDLDGTLTDPAEGITNSIAYALTHRGIEAPPREELLKYIGPPLIPAFMDDYGMTEAEAYETLTEYRVYFEKSGIFENEVYPGIKEMLMMLKANGIKTAVTTSKPEKYARMIIDHFDLAPCFDFVGGSTMEEKRVSKDELISYCMENLGINEKNKDLVTMIGDRSYDVIGAKKRGVYSIGVLYGYGSEKELTDAGADALAHDAGELGRIILSRL